MAWEPGITAFVGCMYSGKTGKIGRRIGQLVRMGEMCGDSKPIKFSLVKPGLDTRDEDPTIVTDHQGNVINGTRAIIIPTNRPSEMMAVGEIKQSQVVLVDEGQFFRPTLAQVLLRFVIEGKCVFFSGLDTDHLGRPFPTTARIMLLPETKIVRCTEANCVDCGHPATHSLRLINGLPAPRMSPRFIVQGKGASYIPVCRTHFISRYQAIGIRIL
ncbi:MAG: hypothetical protein PHH01_02275 [Patescibacteria group bacterium]|nr:hypothetical protein [Patescibacteria group bacterium]